MNTQTKLIRSASCIVGFLLTGCAVIDSEYGDPRPRSQLGVALHEIKGPLQLRMCSDHLIVSTLERGQGIALVDTTTDIVTGFNMLTTYPVNFVCSSDGFAFFPLFSLTDDKTSVAVLNPQTGGLTVSDWWSNYGYQNLSISGGRVFMINQNGLFIDTVISNVQGVTVKRGQLEPISINSVAHTEYGTFVSSDTSTRNIYFRAPGIEGAYQPIPLTDDTAYVPHRRVSTLITHENKVFAIVNYGLDSSSLAVIDAVTHTFVKWIPLNFNMANSGGILNGKLYLYGGELDLWSEDEPDGGIEFVDLESQSHAEVLATEAELGVIIRNFTPTGARSGYAIFSLKGSSDSYVTRINAQSR